MIPIGTSGDEEDSDVCGGNGPEGCGDVGVGVSTVIGETSVVIASSKFVAMAAGVAIAAAEPLWNEPRGVDGCAETPSEK